MVEGKKRGRPAAEKKQKVMAFTLDACLEPYLQRAATEAGYTHARSGKPNVSAWLNALLTKAEAEHTAGIER